MHTQFTHTKYIRVISTLYKKILEMHVALCTGNASSYQQKQNRTRGTAEAGQDGTMGMELFPVHEHLSKLCFVLAHQNTWYITGFFITWKFPGWEDASLWNTSVSVWFSTNYRAPKVCPIVCASLHSCVLSSCQWVNPKHDLYFTFRW